jgi:hypothetical protein
MSTKAKRIAEAIVREFSLFITRGETEYTLAPSAVPRLAALIDAHLPQWQGIEGVPLAQIVEDLDYAQRFFPEEGTDIREGVDVRKSLRLASALLASLPSPPKGVRENG